MGELKRDQDRRRDRALPVARRATFDAMGTAQLWVAQSLAFTAEFERNQSGRLGDAPPARERVEPPHLALFLGNAPIDEGPLDLGQLGAQQ